MHRPEALQLLAEICHPQRADGEARPFQGMGFPTETSGIVFRDGCSHYRKVCIGVLVKRLKQLRIKRGPHFQTKFLEILQGLFAECALPFSLLTMSHHGVFGVNEQRLAAGLPESLWSHTDMENITKCDIFN